jgi:thioredoxin-related protein
MRIAALVFLLLVVFSGIAAIFWYQEMQYLLPTPVPENHRVVLPHEVVQFDSVLIPQTNGKPKLLHFFSPDCPCSRFNVKHFLSLNRKYGNAIDFYVVIADKKNVISARNKIEDEVPVIVDTTRELARACGVYSTPQAALIQQNNQLYFRGNYNRSRFCTDKNSNFVQMAMDSLLAGKGPPHFIELATKSYGCSITGEEESDL